MKRHIAFAVLAMMFATCGLADVNEPLEEVVAVGKQPGPKLWRVTHEGRELWILGVLSPLPKKMDWDTSAVEAVMADAEQVIRPPGVSMSVNPVKSVFVLPSLWGIEKNPDKKKLKDIAPPELYARWSVLKEKYIGGDRGIEKKRPMIAAYELYKEALDDTGLTRNAGVQKSIEKLIKRNKVPVVETGVARRVEKPGNMIKKFKKSEIEDLACFEKTIERIEVDLEVMRSRADAWAVGDVKALRALPYDDQDVTCVEAIMQSSFAEDMVNELDLQDLERVLRDNWLSAAEDALQNHAVTFAFLPIEELLSPDGLISELAARGYAVRGG